MRSGEFLSIKNSKKYLNYKNKKYLNPFSVRSGSEYRYRLKYLKLLNIFLNREFCCKNFALKNGS